MAKSTRKTTRRPAKPARAKRATAAKRTTRAKPKRAAAATRGKRAAAKRTTATTRSKKAAAKRPAAGARAKAATAKRAAAKPRAKTAAAPRRTAAAPARQHVERQQPETLRLRSIAPTLTADDVQRSLAWYRDVLGFIVGDKWESDGTLQGVEMRAGSCVFLLTQDDFAKGRDRQKGVGFRFYCETTQDIDAIGQRIKDAGGTLMQEPADTSWGSRELAVEDPDGFKITVFRKREA